MAPERRNRLLVLGLVGGAALAVAPLTARAQDEAPSPAAPGAEKLPPTPNTTAGEFTPGSGFDLFRSELVSLNVSFYGLARYLNQLGEERFTDHLGRAQTLHARNDIEWHRTFAWLSRFFLQPRFRYTVTIWSLPTTQQTLVFGNLRYRVAQALELGVGIGPNL